MIWTDDQFPKVYEIVDQTILHLLMEAWIHLVKRIQEGKQIKLKINNELKPMARINYWEKELTKKKEVKIVTVYL
jgi:hypothetical protein